MKIIKEEKYWSIHYIDSQKKECVLYHPLFINDLSTEKREEKEITLEILNSIFIDDATTENLAKTTFRLTSQKARDEEKPIISIIYEKRSSDGWFLLHKDDISDHIKNGIIKQEDYRDLIEWYERYLKGTDGLRFDTITKNINGNIATITISFDNMKNTHIAYAKLFAEWTEKDPIVSKMEKYESDMLEKLGYVYKKTTIISP